MDKFDVLIDKIKNIALSVKKKMKRTFVFTNNKNPTSGFPFLVHKGVTSSDFSKMKFFAKDHFQNHFAEK